MDQSIQMSLCNFSQLVNDKNTKIRFILVSNYDEPTGDLKIAYETLLEKFPYKKNIQLINEEECLSLSKIELMPTDVFIMEKFEGAAFRHIEDMENIFILGVQAFCAAFLENVNIPMPICHVHNLALRDTYFCFAKLNEKVKARFQKLVHYMGGQYSSSLRECITHLITEDIFCAKYAHANEHMMRVYRPAFLEDLWKRSQDIEFNYDQKDHFYDQFNVPIFHGVYASSTGIDLENKKAIIEAIQKHGGEFDQTFKTKCTNILFMPRDQVTSAKAQAAFKYKIKCVTPEWVFDSLAAKFALTLDESYLIEKSSVFKASTPTKNTTSLGKFHSLDSTALSDITVASGPQHLTLEETRYDAALQPSSSSNKLRKTMTNQAAKESMNAKNDTFKRPPAFARETRSLAPATVTNSVTSIRSNEKEKSPEKDFTETETEADTEDESFVQFLTGKNVFIYGYQEETEILQMMRECEKFGANVVDADFNKTVDYIITASNVIEYGEPKMKHKNIVNDFWLEECVAEGKCIDRKMYHHPLYKSQFANVLEGELFVLSGYCKDREQPFIKNLIKNLGGICKIVLNKKDSPILICPLPEGRKYTEGALRWNLTALTAEWLFDCYKRKVRCDETNYLVGETPPSSNNKRKDRDSIIPSSQGQHQSESMYEDPNAMEVDYQEEVFVPKRVAELRPRALESPKTPKTPGSPVADGILSLSAMCADMPTPQRELTKAAIREDVQSNKISPRAQRQRELLKTPGPAQRPAALEESSPMPELPAVMKPPEVNQGIRPESSPDSQWQWKMRFDVLDELYQHKSESMKKAYRAGLHVSPYEDKRYKFFAARLPDYDSPDPRSQSSQDAHTMADEAFNIFNNEELLAQQAAENAEQQRLDEEFMKKQMAFEKEQTMRRRLDMDDDEEDEYNKAHEIFWADENYVIPEFSDPAKPARQSNRFRSRRNTSRNNLSTSENDGNKANVPAKKEAKKDSPIKVVVQESQQPENLDSSENEIDFEGNEEEGENAPLASEPKMFQNNFVIAFSNGNMSEDRQNQLHETAKQLGAKTSEENFNCLIISKITKSSKYFCALARGCPVLHLDWLTDSAKAGNFIDWEPYEYGNPKFKFEIPRDYSAELINGPYLCRQLKLNNPEKFESGLFSGMKFIVTTKDKRHIFCSVIESGGGVVIDETSDFKAALLKREKVDYCFIDHQNAINQKDIKTLNACNVIIKNVRFIYDYLLSEIHK